MHSVRDLACDDLWQQSLERSRARRENSKRSGPQRRPRTATRSAPQRRPPPGRRSRPQRRPPTTGRSRPLVLIAGCVLLVALTGATFSGALNGRATLAAHTAAASRTIKESLRPAPAGQWCGASSARACQAVAETSGYVNPLANAHVIPERIDQGVDYAGSGTLTALGPARITHVDRSAPGWPGAFIEYRLTLGPDAGRYVYYAEGVIPVPELRVGRVVSAGEPIATIIRGYPSGIELGWGAGTGSTTYAHKIGNWDHRADVENLASRTGKSFSALIASLGGPPGKVEG